MLAEELYEVPIVVVRPVKQIVILDTPGVHLRLNVTDAKLTLLTWMVGAVAAMMLAVMIKVFS